MDAIPDHVIHKVPQDPPNTVKPSSPSDSRLFVVPLETYDTSMCGPFATFAEAKVVPAIASHWGVILEIPRWKGVSYSTLYHLTFNESQDRSSSQIHRQVALHFQMVDTTFGTEVGTTQYSMEEVYEIVGELVKEFRSYHHVVWIY